MSNQLQQRAVQVAGRLSVVAQVASKRICVAQEAVLAERAEREAKEARLFKIRFSRAKSGLRRLLMFAGSRSIQRLVKTNERLFEKGKNLQFHQHEWNLIGLDLQSHVSFSIGSSGVRIMMTNYCWVTCTASAVFPYKRPEVSVSAEFGGRSDGAWISPVEDVLHRMAIGLMSPLNKISEESEVAFRLLASWSRLAPFEKVAVAFLEKLEQQAAWESREKA